MRKMRERESTHTCSLKRMQVNKIAEPLGILMWHVCFSKVSVEVTDAAGEVGNRKFTYGCFCCLLEVRLSQRGSGMVELGLGKDVINK